MTGGELVLQAVAPPSPAGVQVPRLHESHATQDQPEKANLSWPTKQHSQSPAQVYASQLWHPATSTAELVIFCLMLIPTSYNHCRHHLRVYVPLCMSELQGRGWGDSSVGKELALQAPGSDSTKRSRHDGTCVQSQCWGDGDSRGSRASRLSLNW